jgi:hypothetical protein
MKRKIFSIMAIAAIALTSCKKDEPATSELGEATINGNVWADLDQTDDFENGIYVSELNPEGVEGMQVYIEINTADYVQNPVGGYDYETRTYTTTTDANGDYTFTIPATEEGFDVDIYFEDMYTTRTVLAEDGVTGLTENVEVTRGDISAYIYNGAMIMKKNEASVSLVNGGANEYGTATMFGNVYIDWNVGPNQNGSTGCGNDEIANAISPLTGMSFYWAYQDGDGPYGEGEGIWTEVPIATDGSYTFDITTEDANGNDVDIMFGFDDFIGSYTRGNIAFTADSVITAIYSIGGKTGESQFNFTAGELRNHDICNDINATEL